MLVEVPYSFIQAVLYVVITYPMIGYDWSAYKIFWSFYGMFCTLLSFNYLGMLLVSLTPNVQVASIVASSAYTMLNLFSGFVIPRPVSLWIIKFNLHASKWQKSFLSRWYDPFRHSKEIFERGKLTWACSFLDAANPKVVALVVLFMSYIMGTKWNAYSAVWRYTAQDPGVRGD